MMRLPRFEFHSPRTVGQAANILAGEGADAMVLAGGTGLLPNMKRRQQMPAALVSLQHVPELHSYQVGGKASRFGACLTLAAIAEVSRFRDGFSALWQAASQVATPHIRNMATLGGNLCLDTRCNYYDQSYEWRKAIDFCIKKDGTRCWVAPGSRRCLAVSSTDTAPALIALGARVRLTSHSGEREISLSDLYNNDGIQYMTRRPDEILTEVLIGSLRNWKSTYWKLRRRGSFDFPVLSVAAAVKMGAGGEVEEARIVVGSAASRPLQAVDAAAFLIGRPLDPAVIGEASALASRIARPLDNTDFDMTWRKRVTNQMVKYALRELSGEAVCAERASLIRREFSRDSMT